MSAVQCFNLQGEALGQPVDAASYVRAPVVGDLVFVRQIAMGQPQRMQVVGAEHRSIRQGGGLVPALALFVAPYPGARHETVPQLPDNAKLELPDGH